MSRAKNLWLPSGEWYEALKIVVTAAARQTVTISRTIQSLAVPRAGRAEPLETPDSHSADKAREEDNLCQKSELAIRETQTSNFQKRLNGVLLGLIRKGIEAKQKCITTERMENRAAAPPACPSKKDTGKAKELRSVSFSGLPWRRQGFSLAMHLDGTHHT